MSDEASFLFGFSIGLMGVLYFVIVYFIIDFIKKRK